MDNKKIRIILLAVYAAIMLIFISNQIDIIYFLLLFVVAPIVIYLFVQKIYPKDTNEREV